MRLTIPRDYFDNPKPPEVYLCDTSRKIIGELPVYNLQGDFKWNSYSEIHFSVDRSYTDVLTGESINNPLFDKIEFPRIIYLKNVGYFALQDSDANYSDKDTKNISAFSLEYSTAGSKYLTNFKINKGEVDSKEVLYNESVYGTDYSMDNLYKKALGLPYDPYEKYYIKKYTGEDSYTWEQVEVSNKTVYNTYDGTTVEKTLWVTNYKNIQFYNKTNPKLSLLHYIFEKIPEWKIGNVDQSLWRKERSFDESWISIYDFLMNKVADTFKCVIVWDTLKMTVNIYEEADDGILEDNTIQSMFDSDVFISRDNLASTINVKYSSENIKTKLKVSGADDLSIREVNLGKNYIMNLDFFHNSEWMDQDVLEAYDNYLAAVDTYSPQYTEAMQGWVAANNRWNNLMNAVPAEGNVVLVGDKFEKLYCTYSPTDTAYINKTLTDDDLDTTVDVLYSNVECTIEIDKSLLLDGDAFIVQGYSFMYVSENDNYKCTRHITSGISMVELKKKLTQYHVNEDTGGNKSDNILLRLKNNNSDVATIRIYNSSTKDNPTYLIQKFVVAADSGIEGVETYSLAQWVMGDLTAEYMHLEGYKVQYIGTLGAYFVLCKDERMKINLQDYGIKMLQEKQDVYTTIFQTQTESMFSQEKYQCVVSDESPIGLIPEGTRWLDSDSSPVKLYKYNKQEKQWELISPEVSTEDQAHYEDYQRYIDNYEKLKAVQEVLLKKEREAQYCSDGYVVSNRRIDISAYDETYYSPSGRSLEDDMRSAAESHFDGYSVIKKELDVNYPLYTFTTSFDPSHIFAVYLKGTTPYVSYAESSGVYQAKMNYISEQTELENFFTDESLWIKLSPLIREDEFSDDNVLLNGLESEEQRLDIYRELMDLATKELKTLSQPSLEFSMDMANILALPEFEPLVNQFKLGNFIRVQIQNGLVKRTRLLEIHLDYNDLSAFSCNFGNLVTTKSETDLHAELLKQAVTAGKTVATSSSSWQKAVDKSNKLEKAISDGLQDCAINIGKASGQAISWDHTGMHFRKYIDGSNTEFEKEEMAIMNNALVATNDNWRTSKAAFGKYVVNGEERWGPIAEYVTADTIEGKFISGGSIEIGSGNTKFIVNEDGSVEIRENGSSKYATSTDVSIIKNAYRFRVELTYSGSTVFSEPNSKCIITAKVYSYNDDITDKLPSGTTYSWKRSSNVGDTDWNTAHANQSSNTITITNDDVEDNAQFSCEVVFNDEGL